MFGFTTKAPSPLTEFCTRLDANLLEASNRVMAEKGTNVDKRASILALLIMAAFPFDQAQRRELKAYGCDEIFEESRSPLFCAEERDFCSIEASP
ncbi:hypothetical protein [Bradyrhizobium iriomotense]|uniref:hypothetical protein n=1 Tax=Bradyrhizobium iriomotense TaxID=441950 RepID=UPI001B8A6C25|nr:hypothetical protein [Bradyrhizobium iriomotense]MBR0783922.1 hypothetical protein [Bradyrhizobium iriomotense]